MKRSWRGIFALTAGVLAALPLAAQGGTGMRLETPSLAVAGHGEARVAPDEATVRLGVQAQDANAGAAQAQVNRTATAVLAAVRRLGVRPEQIRTSELSLSPVYAPPPPPLPGQEPPPARIAGYQASNVVTVTLEKLDQVGPVIDAGLQAGANRLEGVGFELRHDEPALQAALRRAVEQARGKAVVLAAALHVRLVSVLEVSEEGVAVVPPPFAGVRAMAPAEAGVVGTPVSSGEVEVTAGVTVRYAIAACPAQGACE
jgi:uncharacterized protein